MNHWNRLSKKFISVSSIYFLPLIMKHLNLQRTCCDMVATGCKVSMKLWPMKVLSITFFFFHRQNENHSLLFLKQVEMSLNVSINILLWALLNRKRNISFLKNQKNWLKNDLLSVLILQKKKKNIIKMLFCFYLKFAFFAAPPRKLSI